MSQTLLQLLEDYLRDEDQSGWGRGWRTIAEGVAAEGDLRITALVQREKEAREAVRTVLDTYRAMVAPECTAFTCVRPLECFCLTCRTPLFRALAKLKAILAVGEHVDA